MALIPEVNTHAADMDEFWMIPTIIELFKMDKYKYFDKTEKLTTTRGENLWRCNYKENGVFLLCEPVMMVNSKAKIKGALLQCVFNHCANFK